MSVAILVLVGVLAGVMSGMFGIGGGIVIVPALVLLAGFSLVEATGTSLAAILLPVGLLGVIAYYKARIIDIRAAAWMAAGLMISVAAGAWLANALPADTMRIIYAVFLLYMSWEFIEPRRRVLRALGKDAPAKPEPETAPRAPAPALVGVGLAAGVMSGLFGIGGGNIIVPFLTIFLGYPAKRAIATSLATILLPMRLPGVLVFWREGTLDLAAAVPVALGIFLGTVFGARITIRLPSATVKLLYGLFLLFMAARFFF